MRVDGTVACLTGHSQPHSNGRDKDTCIHAQV